MRSFVLCFTILLLFAMPSSAVAQASCDDFASQGRAQFALDTLPKLTQDTLDPDGDGIACESLPPGSATGGSAGSNTQATKPPSSTDTEITDQEQAYFDALVDDTDQFAEVADEVGQLFTEAGQDPTLILDEDWMIDLASQLVQWQVIGEDAQVLDPSPRQQPIHALWLEINRLTTLAVDDIVQGIDFVDPAAFDSASARIVYATLLTDDLTNATLAFLDDPNTPITPENPIAPVLDCEPFPNYETAQLYLAANPEEQVTIDPDFDGLACEVFFEME